MSISISLPLLIVFSVFLINANCYEEDNGITILNDENYHEAIKEFPNIIIKMYAPWCGHCIALAPEYVEAARRAKEAQLPIRFAEIDLTANEKINEEENVEGFPTIKLYQNGKSKEFNGERKADAIMIFIKKKLYGNVFKFSSLIEVTEFVNKNRVVIMTTVSSEENEAGMKEFNESADKEADMNFIECIVKECKDKYKAPIVMIRDFNKESISFPYKDITKKSIGQFIQWYSFAPASLITDANIELLYQYNETALVLFRNEKQKDLDVLMRKLGNEYIEKLHFLVINADGDEVNQRVAEYFFVTESDQPLIKMIVFVGESDSHFTMKTKEINEQSIKQFISDFIAGKVVKEPLSEALNPDREGMLPLVGMNFVKEVIESTKAIFVLFTTDTDCDQCGDYFNSWAELGQKYADSTDVNYGAINMNANEVYGMKIEKFPVMKLYLLGKKDQPIEYTGLSAVIEIEEWMAWKLEWANKPITLPKEDL